MRLFLKGPRSLTRTTTDLPLRTLRTSRSVPNGSEGWAAVISFISKRSPLAVRRPWNLRPYQDAVPFSSTRLFGRVSGLRFAEQAERRAQQAIRATAAREEGQGFSRVLLGM